MFKNQEQKEVFESLFLVLCDWKWSPEQNKAFKFPVRFKCVKEDKEGYCVFFSSEVLSISKAPPSDEKKDGLYKDASKKP